MRRDICPTCNKNSKQVRSKTCVSCARRAFAQQAGSNHSLRNYSNIKRPAGFIVIDRNEADLIRPLTGVENKASWRPPHYPPPCEVCNGFPYLSSSEGYSACGGCKDHPGHAMSFAAWDKVRP